MQCSRHDRWADEPHFASLLKISGFKIRVRVRLSVNHAAATRLVFGLSHSDHVTPTQIQLLWLLVSYRIRFKLCCLVHAIHYGRSPAYLTETVQSVGASRSRCGLRSSSTSSMGYSLPRLRTKFGERAFSHAGPATWNALPDHIRTVADPVKFQKLLKSRYFSQAFNIC